MCGGMKVRTNMPNAVSAVKIFRLSHRPTVNKPWSVVFLKDLWFLATRPLWLQHDELLTMPLPMGLHHSEFRFKCYESPEVLNGYDIIHCYLDNDAAGRKATEKLKDALNREVRDQSVRYPDYNDKMTTIKT